MADKTKIESIVSEEKTRRSAIKTAAQVAVTAPAVGLLLSASTKVAAAYTRVGDDAVIQDDFGLDDTTFGDDGVTGGGTN
jgi:hypothetical protein